MRRVGLAGLVLVFAAGCASTTPPATLAPPSPSPAPAGFASPEEAVRDYLTSVKNADADAIIAASAADDAAENYDFSGQAERLQVLILQGYPGPAEYPFYAETNRAWFGSRLLAQAQTLSYSLLSSNEIGAVPIPADGADASAFADEVDPAGLAALEIVDVQPPRASMEDDPRHRENSLEVAAIYGADDDVQRVALVKLGDQHYEVGFELLNYGDAWKVLFQTSSLAGLDATGVAEPITPEEFYEQISE